MHDDVLEETLGEDAPTLPVGIVPGPVNAMRQLDRTHRRERDVDLAVRSTNPAQDVLDGLSTAFARDQDAGIEDQPHADVSRGFRFRMISSMSAANSASMTGSYPSSFE